MTGAVSRRTFVFASSAALAAVHARAAEPSKAPEFVGPLLGHVDATSAIVWARFPGAGKYIVELLAANEETQRVEANATESTDFTAQWRFSNLKAGTTYRYRLVENKQLVPHRTDGTFTTAPAPDAKAKVSLALGSCAKEDVNSRAVWSRMLEEKIDGLILCGDTPYIDSTDLTKQRTRHREFISVPELQELLGYRPCWGTWDDHDFGKNDSDGRLPGKANARQAFTEYRALASYGHQNAGVYTSFRYGPIEVFVIDARWFANTGPSPVDPKKPTLLGPAQWEWLTKGLKQSTAPFKLLACGMIWDDKRNKESDDWETYSHERTALFEFIRKERISGVVLFGGDIHVSRVLRYEAEKTVGYPLYQFISSPIHERVIPSLNVPHPNLIYSALEPHTFLKLTADTTGPEPKLTAEFINKDGKRLFDDITVSLADASPKSKPA